MTSHTPNGNTLADAAEQIKQKIANATDLNKLFKDNKFLEQLQKLPQAEQFQIFEQYKDKFNKISTNPGLAINEWTTNLTKAFPQMAPAQNLLKNGVQQGEHILEDLRNSLGQFSPNHPK